MSRQEANTRLDNQLSRRNCQMFSTGFNSGARAGSSTSVRLSGTTKSLVRCHPARSISMTPWAPGATACATSAKFRLQTWCLPNVTYCVLGRKPVTCDGDVVKLVNTADVYSKGREAAQLREWVERVSYLDR